MVLFVTEKSITQTITKSKHIFRKYVRKICQKVLTTENMFVIIRLKEQMFANKFSRKGFLMDIRAYEAVLNREERNRMRKAKRVRQLRRRFFMAIMTVVLVLVLAVSYHAFLSEANTGEKEISYKYYTSIEVSYGETLWTIADEYACAQYDSLNDYVDEVMQINHLKEELIIAGQYLIIPYYSTVLK